MATVWPQVVNKLLAVWTAAAQAGDEVFDGPPTSVDLVSRWVTVGFQEDQDQSSAGQVQHQQVYDGLSWGETGSVLCEVIATSADPGISTVRAAAFGFLDVLLAAVRADLSLGGLVDTLDLVVDPFQVADATSAESRIRLTVNYTILITS